jgi:UDP-glucose 4-epimerase
MHHQNSPSRALVTGAAGFIGRHVAQVLSRRGYRVMGLGHGFWESPCEWGVSEWINDDITLQNLRQICFVPDVIVQCAGSGSVASSLERPHEDFGRTVDTTLAVLEFTRVHAPHAALVLPSSAAVYGVVKRGPISIYEPLNPASPYGQHKKIAEELVLSYARHFGIRGSIVRLFSVFGAGLRKQLWWDACKKFDCGQSEFAGSGTETRDWLHVEDAASLLVKASEQATPNVCVVNGGVGIGTPISEIVFALADELAFGVTPLFTGRSKAGDPTHYQADISQALELGWSPLHNWRTEVAPYVRWFREGAK